MGEMLQGTPVVPDLEGPLAQIDGLADLLAQFNDTTGRLARSHERLEQEVGRLQRELEEKNRILARRNRLAALGKMAAGVAHEIRNPLGGISLYASLLSREVEDRPASRRLVEKILGGTRLLNGIVEEMLAFTAEVRPRVEKVEVARVMQEALDLIAGRPDNRGIEVVRRFDPDTPVIRADAQMLTRVFVNLLANALEALDGGGRITLAAERAPLDEEEAVRVIVEDSGPGFSRGAEERIFEPFYTAKANGLGLGLAIVQQVIEAHRGEIRACNAPGGGARFEALLPVAGPRGEGEAPGGLPFVEEM